MNKEDSMILASNLYDSLCYAIEKVMVCLEQEKQIITKFDFSSIASILVTKKEVIENYKVAFAGFLNEKSSKLLPKEKKIVLTVLINDLQEKMIENQQIIDKGIKLNQKMMQLFLKLTKQTQPYTSKGVVSKSKMLSKAVAIDEQF